MKSSRLAPVSQKRLDAAGGRVYSTFTKKKRIGGCFVGKPMRKVSTKKAKENREQAKSKAVLMKLNDGVCSFQIPGVCQWFASDFAHIKGQAQGGGYTTKDGRLGCRMCHKYATEHPQEAYEKGWAVKSWQRVPNTKGA